MSGISTRELFFKHVAQTSDAPIALEISKAEGVYLEGIDGKKYVDLIAGFSVNNIGHSHPKVVQAVQEQVAKYMHLIVYGEFIEQPQVAYAHLLTTHLPNNLNCVYFTNSGAEATEGALKLAKRVTQRTKIIAFNKSYHGSTHGALSLMGNEYWRNAYRPLLPDVHHFNYNDWSVLDAINHQTAAVVIEPVQAESGVTAADVAWLTAIRKRCDDCCCLLIFDEIQSGFGRTGTLWAFEQFKIVPDILLLGKALGGGMPLGAFISSQKLMSLIAFNPVLGHITTFGGHPVSCAAGKAAFEVLLQDKLISNLQPKIDLLSKLVHHPKIQKIQQFGFWMSLEIEDEKKCMAITKKCVEKGVITDWFLFAPNKIRIAPPLTIDEPTLVYSINIIHQSIDEVML